MPLTCPSESNSELWGHKYPKTLHTNVRCQRLLVHLTHIFFKDLLISCVWMSCLCVCIYATFVSDALRSGDGVRSPMLHLASLKLSQTLWLKSNSGRKGFISSYGFKSTIKRHWGKNSSHEPGGRNWIRTCEEKLFIGLFSLLSSTTHNLLLQGRHCS